MLTGGTLFGTDSLSGGTFAFSDPNAGSNKTVTVSGVTVSDGNGGANYTVTHADNTTSTINKADLTVTANNASKTYDGLAWSGGNGVSYSGFVNGETSAVLSGSLSYGGNSQGATNAGSYAITPGGLTAANYTISFTDGTLTINPTPVVISLPGLGVGADDKSKTYGSPDPELTWHIASGTLAPGDSLGGSLVRDPGENVGTYAIRQGSLSAGPNYTLSFTNGTLTINKADAVITANNATLTYNGREQSVSGFTATGLVNGDTESALTGVSAGGSGTKAGTYATRASGSADNYNLRFVDGTLTINKADAVVTANSATAAYNGQEQSVSGFTAAGLVNGETESVLTGVSAGGSGTKAGTYVTRAAGSADNYNLRFIDGTLTIVGEPPNVPGEPPNVPGAPPNVPGAPDDAHAGAVASAHAADDSNASTVTPDAAKLAGLLTIVGCGQSLPPTLPKCR